MRHGSTFGDDFAHWLGSPFRGIPTDKYKNAVIVNNIDVRPVQRKHIGIDTWRKALVMAEGPTQNRLPLYEVYKECLLDGVLKRTVSKRRQAVTNCRFVFMSADGQEVPEITNLFKKSYFRHLLEFVINARLYGHALIELGWPAADTDPNKGWSEEVDRRYVRPRHGLVVPNQATLSGYQFRSDEFSDTVFEAGHHEDLGDILEACQYAIFKEGGFSDLAEYVEVFGMPFRWAKSNNPETREMLKEVLENAGAAGFVVAPDDADIETVHAPTGGQSSSSHSVLIDACNKEIQWCILGQTMTMTESSSGGYAQAKVQQDEQGDLDTSDYMFAEAWLNENIVDYLVKLGYPAAGGSIVIPEEDRMNLHQRIDVDLKLNSIIPIPASYFYNKYHIPVPTLEDPPVSRQVEEEPDEPDTEDDEGPNEEEA